MVEVFRTSVKKKAEAEKIVNALQKEFSGFKINFDLQDCEKILRVEGENIPVEEIIRLMESRNHPCTVLT
jgi:hypothetical protein